MCGVQISFACTLDIESQLESIRYAYQLPDAIGKIVQEEKITQEALGKIFRELDYHVEGLEFQDEFRVSEDSKVYLKNFIEKLDFNRGPELEQDLYKLFMTKRIQLLQKDLKEIEFGLFSEDFLTLEASFKVRNKKLDRSTACLIDAASLGLSYPEDVNGRLFVTCAHLFKEIEFREGKVNTSDLWLELEKPIQRKEGTFFEVKHYKIDSLFLPQEYPMSDCCEKGDVMFGILRESAQDIRPLSLSALSLDNLTGKKITVSGYGVGYLKGSKKYLRDGMKRAGELRVKPFDFLPHCSFKSVDISNPYSRVGIKIQDPDNLPMKKRIWGYLEGEPTGLGDILFEALSGKIGPERADKEGAKIIRNIEDELRNSVRNKSNKNLEFSNLLNAGISISLKFMKLPIVSTGGHSGSPLMVYDKLKKEWTTIGVVSKGYAVPTTAGTLNATEEKILSLEEKIKGVQEYFQNVEREEINSSSCRTISFYLKPYAQRFSAYFNQRNFKANANNVYFF